MEKDKKQILGKLKLNKLSENELEKREMRILKGGSDCPDGWLSKYQHIECNC